MAGYDCIAVNDQAMARREHKGAVKGLYAEAIFTAWRVVFCAVARGFCIEGDGIARFVMCSHKNEWKGRFDPLRFFYE